MLQSRFGAVDIRLCGWAVRAVLLLWLVLASRLVQSAWAAEWSVDLPPSPGITGARFELWTPPATSRGEAWRVVVLVSAYEGAAGIYGEPEWRRWAEVNRAVLVRHRVVNEGERFVLVRGEVLAAALVRGLERLAEMSTHPEIATVPWVATGLSQAGWQAHSLANARPDRVAAVIAWHASTNVRDPAQYEHPGGRQVPMLHLMAGRERFPIDVRPAVIAARGQGAPWAYALQVGVAHHELGPVELPLAWLTAVLTGRLAPAGAGSLRPIRLEGGWVARSVEIATDPFDRRVTRADVAAWHEAAADREELPWWPDEQTARAWLAATPVEPGAGN